MEKKNKLVTKGKNINHSNNKEEVAKTGVHYLEEYKDMFSLKYKPINQNFITRLAEDISAWVVNDKNALDLEDFLVLKGIPTRTFYNWTKKYPDIADAHENVMRILGKRRERGIIEKRYEPGWTGRSLRMYLPEWSENEEWYAKVKSNEQNTAQTINVVLEQFPETDIVPKRKIE